MPKIEEVLFDSEEKTTRSDAAVFLRKLADKLEAGQISLSQGEQKVQLEIPRKITLEVKVEKEIKSEKIKHSLEVELEWTEGEGENSSGIVVM
ncbi:amphi-Trp domain-containing protein [Peptococcaceae bacterium]|nr:amphi-Trp domain-containing protein [Peptococcaceae bacterium]